ncbi:MAG TPA: hypothetical protein VFN65_06830 [Solirubrobacteraceae bacterium]|nr:hypothetical protein [Solirubrobacteraceae bacterium]
MRADGELRLTRVAVQAAVRDERTWEAAGVALDVRPGLAFMVATGVPADGGGVPDLSERTGAGPTLSSPQSLVNPREHNPLRNDIVEAWVRARAERELR